MAVKDKLISNEVLKAVNDNMQGQVTDLKSAIENIDIFFDKYDENEITSGYALRYDSGNPATLNVGFITDCIPVSAGNVVCVPNQLSSSTYAHVFYSADKTIISKFYANADNTIMTAPSGAAYFRASGYLPKVNEMYVRVYHRDLTESEIAEIRNELTSTVNTVNGINILLDAMGEYYAPTNLYNKNSPLNRENVKISASGNYEAVSGSSVSHPIKVDFGKTYTFKYSAGFYGVATNRIVRFCDSEGNLDTGNGRYWSATDNGTASGTFTVTEDVGYVCVNVRMSDAGVMVFNEGDALAEYSDWFEPYYAIKASALPSDIPLPDNAQGNLLYGKKLAVTGDSICYGAGSSGGYAAIIGANNNMSISNIAVSGGTICSGTVTSGGSSRFCISASVDNMPQDYDYYIVEGGVNDADTSTGATLGAISSGYNATLDTATMCGAMESLCKKLQTNFPGKKYGFIFPHNVYGDASVWNTGWRNEMKKCLNKWGIPYLDLSDECAQLRNIDALRVYTSSSDGWHPTEDGYKLYYVPKIEAWLKSL